MSRTFFLFTPIIIGVWFQLRMVYSDLSECKDPVLPKVRVGARVMDLVNGLHFDDILMDTPDDLRPSAVVAFYNSSDPSCMETYSAWKWDHVAETKLPPRERLFISRYDMYAAPRRPWYKFVPELDLAKRMDVQRCPELVFVSRQNNGFLEWCKRGEPDAGLQYVGCDQYNDYLHDLEKWDQSEEMDQWIARKIQEEQDQPKLAQLFNTFAEQGQWILKRDITSTDNHLRNIYLSEAFPNFTATGFQVMPIPEELMKWLTEFYERNENTRRLERWESESTQMSFTEIPTTFIDLDLEREAKEKIANEILKPIVEKWSNTTPLELTSFYGLREYPKGSFLKNHVDRIDTHILSVTISFKKEPSKHTWPMEVIQFSGDHVRHEHPEGTMLLYESSKLPHGRPYRNRGGLHVGAFCHFKPVHWSNDIAERARQHQAENTEFATYTSTPSVDPPIVHYSQTDYGSGIYHESFVATFENRSPQDMYLVWISPEGDSRIQGFVKAHSQVAIKTYVGHVFYWSPSNEDLDLQHPMKMDDEETIYYYYSNSNQ